MATIAKLADELRRHLARLSKQRDQGASLDDVARSIYDFRGSGGAIHHADVARAFFQESAHEGARHVDVFWSAFGIFYAYPLTTHLLQGDIRKSIARHQRMAVDIEVRSRLVNSIWGPGKNYPVLLNVARRQQEADGKVTLYRGYWLPSDEDVRVGRVKVGNADAQVQAEFGRNFSFTLHRQVAQYFALLPSIRDGEGTDAAVRETETMSGDGENARRIWQSEDSRPVVIKGRADLADVLFVFAGYNEQEVVVDPARVTLDGYNFVRAEERAEVIRALGSGTRHETHSWLASLLEVDPPTSAKQDAFWSKGIGENDARQQLRHF
jgi:hypothetical protein